MNICIECRNIYDEDFQFCLFDGTILTDVEPSEEKTVSLLTKETANVVIPPPMPFRVAIPQQSPTEIQTTIKQSHTKFLMVLIAIVLILSMSIILTTIGFAGIRTSNNDHDKSVRKASASNTIETKQKNESPEIINNKKQVKPLPIESREISAEQTQKVTKKYFKGSNARIIMLNAIIRSAPTMDADEKEIVQLDEPIKISMQNSPNSPWYRVITASGIKGWIHGNMFEFTR